MHLCLFLPIVIMGCWSLKVKTEVARLYRENSLCCVLMALWPFKMGENISLPAVSSHSWIFTLISMFFFSSFFMSLPIAVFSGCSVSGPHRSCDHVWGPGTRSDGIFSLLVGRLSNAQFCFYFPVDNRLYDTFERGKLGSHRKWILCIPCWLTI